MRAVFSSLMAAALLIHAVMGCCWHNAHDRMCFNGAIGALAANCDCCHHDREGASPQSPSHNPSHDKSNCQGLCTYLPPQQTQVDTLESHVPVDFAAIVPATCDAQVAAVFCTVRTHETAAEPPLRLHLLHQILLI